MQQYINNLNVNNYIDFFIANIVLKMHYWQRIMFHIVFFSQLKTKNTVFIFIETLNISIAYCTLHIAQSNKMYSPKWTIRENFKDRISALIQQLYTIKPFYSSQILKNVSQYCTLSSPTTSSWALTLRAQGRRQGSDQTVLSLHR